MTDIATLDNLRGASSEELTSAGLAIKFINTATLTDHIEKHGPVPAVAKAIAVVNGHLLIVTIDKQKFVLSTWRSDKPRLFKRADALLSEATKVGLTNVTFALRPM